MHDVIGVPDPPERITEEVVERLAELYRAAASARRRRGRGRPANRRALAARHRLVVEPAADRPLPRAHRARRSYSGRLFPRRKWRTASRPRTATLEAATRLEVAPTAVQRSRIQRTASARPVRQDACHRDSEPRLSAVPGGGGAGRRRTRVARRAHTRGDRGHLAATEFARVTGARWSSAPGSSAA